jgi:2-aminomuconate deaminase
MINKEINTSKVPDGRPSFHPHARRVGEFIYISGLIARKAGLDKIPGVELDDQGNVTSYDIEVQTRAVFDNLVSILEEAGSTLEKVIDITVFLTNIKADFKAFNRVYGEIMKDIHPCRTTVEVVRFPSPVQIEIKCIAIV